MSAGGGDDDDFARDRSEPRVATCRVGSLRAANVGSLVQNPPMVAPARARLGSIWYYLFYNGSKFPALPTITMDDIGWRRCGSAHPVPMKLHPQRTNTAIRITLEPFLKPCTDGKPCSREGVF